MSNVSRNVKIMGEVQSDEIRNKVERNIGQTKRKSGDSAISEAWNSLIK